MKIGACAGCRTLDRLEVLAKTGFDYVETGFAELTDCSDDELDEFIENLESLGLDCEVANSLLPADIKLTGNEADYDKIREFLERGMVRAKKVGIEVVVFGSAAARNYPEGFSFDRAYEQLVAFLRDYLGPIAARQGLCAVVEPLSTMETNIIHTVADGVKLAKASGCYNVKGLADNFHMAANNDSVDEIYGMHGWILHSHIAHGVTRMYPKRGDGFDYKPFIDALQDAGCLRCTIEANSQDIAADAPEAFELLKGLVV